MREDDIHVVQLETLETFLRTFNNAIQAGGDRSQFVASGSEQFNCISKFRAHCFLDKPLSFGPGPPQNIFVVTMRSVRFTSSSLKTRPLESVDSR